MLGEDEPGIRVAARRQGPGRHRSGATTSHRAAVCAEPLLARARTRAACPGLPAVSRRRPTSRTRTWSTCWPRRVQRQVRRCCWPCRRAIRASNSACSSASPTKRRRRAWPGRPGPRGVQSAESLRRRTCCISTCSCTRRPRRFSRRRAPTACCAARATSCCAAQACSRSSRRSPAWSRREFVRETRFDPLHEGGDRTTPVRPGCLRWLDALAESGRGRRGDRVRHHHAPHHAQRGATVGTPSSRSRPTCCDSCSRARPAGLAVQLCVSHRVAGLPGLVDAPRGAARLRGRALPRGAAALGALAAARIDRAPGRVDRARASVASSVMRRQRATRSRPRSRSCRRRSIPTHVLFRGRAWPITADAARRWAGPSHRCAARAQPAGGHRRRVASPIARCNGATARPSSRITARTARSSTTNAWRPCRAARRRRAAARCARRDARTHSRAAGTWPRRKFDIFSMSFLDTICCAFGALVLLYMILNAAGSKEAAEGQSQICAPRSTSSRRRCCRAIRDLVVLRNSHVDRRPTRRSARKDCPTAC